MSWADLCNGKTVDGKSIDLKTLINPNVNYEKRNKTGLPIALALGNLVDKAGKLKLTKGNGSGISFTICEALINDDNSVNAMEKFKKFVNQKQGASVCYEDTFLPLLGIRGGHVIVHQSVAPCKRCRAGYKAWAKQLNRTVIVSADDGYDGAPDDTVFIFCPTGLVLYG